MKRNKYKQGSDTYQPLGDRADQMEKNDIEKGDSEIKILPRKRLKKRTKMIH